MFPYGVRNCTHIPTWIVTTYEEKTKKILNWVLTETQNDDIICYVLIRPKYMACSNGTRNVWRGIEVVITRRSWKPFVRKGTWVRIPSSPLGGNVIEKEFGRILFLMYYNRINIARVRAALEKYPSWPKGHPWKGCRSLIAARGFKSLLLRSLENISKKLLTNNAEYVNII